MLFTSLEACACVSCLDEDNILKHSSFSILYIQFSYLDTGNCSYIEGKTLFTFYLFHFCYLFLVYFYSFSNGGVQNGGEMDMFFLSFLKGVSLCYFCC